jgi:hypothetical protein
MHTTVLKKIISFLGVLSILSCLFFRTIAHADETILPTADDQTTSLTMTPSILENVVAPGKNEIKNFELKNNSNFPLPIKCYIRTFDASNETGDVAIADQVDVNRLAPTSWVSVVEPDFILQPQSTKEMAVNFNPPADLPPGGYYAILFAEPLVPESFLNESSLQVGGRIGSLLFLIGPGDIHEKAKLDSVDLPRFSFGSRPLQASIRIENQGNVHLRPSGKVTLTNRLTKSAQVVAIPEVTILPGKIRQEEIALSPKWPGIYSVDVNIKYGRDNTALTASRRFYYFPVSAILVTIAVLLVLVLLILPKSRRRLKKTLAALFAPLEK